MRGVRGDRDDSRVGADRAEEPDLVGGVSGVGVLGEAGRGGRGGRDDEIAVLVALVTTWLYARPPPPPAMLVTWIGLSTTPMSYMILPMVRQVKSQPPPGLAGAMHSAASAAPEMLIAPASTPARFPSRSLISCLPPDRSGSQVDFVDFRPTVSPGS